ncbi:MAG: tetratricopeptide repeat protein, partial [Micrococcales bacterium]|nr:tetratricopeptide repeat protein [Micrococcales bacterium]
MNTAQESALVDALRRAVAAAPDDAELRLHLADVLLAAGRNAEAVTEAAAVLQRDATNPRARELMGRALTPAAASSPSPASSPAAPAAASSPSDAAPSDAAPSDATVPAPSLPTPPSVPSSETSQTTPPPAATQPTQPTQPASTAAPTPEATGDDEPFDWSRAEQELGLDVQPPFVTNEAPDDKP